MKKLMMMMAAAIVSGLSWAAGVEQLSIVVNEIATIQVPFGITSYLPSNMDVVRIEEVSGTSLRVTALRKGRCDLDVHGDKDLVQKYEITVLGDLATTLDTLNSELDQVQEVRARVVGDFIRIDGEISSIQRWEYLQKVLRNYSGVVRNFAVFSPGPDVMLRLKETLQDSGFSVVFQSLGKDRKTWPANQVALVLNKQTRIMTVQGRVYTPEQQKKIAECLETERWLSMSLTPTKESWTDEEFRIRGKFDVFVDKPQVRISVAFMSISDTDLKNIGNPDAIAGNGVLEISSIANLFGGLMKTRGLLGDLKWTTPDEANAGAILGRVGATARPRYGNASVFATLDVTSRFLKQNGFHRISDTGYTVMESWDAEGAQFKSGGTLYVKTRGLDSGDLKPVPYGFVLKTKGGVTPTGDALDSVIDFELSSIDYVTGDEVSIKEEKSKQRLALPLGRTTFIGGVKMVEEDRVSPSGLPILRNTPMLNWFVAESGTTKEDRRLVIMVCPEIVDNSKDGTLEVEKEVNIPVSTEGVKSTEQREEEKRPFSGGLWNPLNWFAF